MDGYGGLIKMRGCTWSIFLYSFNPLKQIRRMISKLNGKGDIMKVNNYLIMRGESLSNLQMGLWIFKWGEIHLLKIMEDLKGMCEVLWSYRRRYSINGC